MICGGRIRRGVRAFPATPLDGKRPSPYNKINHCLFLVDHFQYLPGYCLRRASLDSFPIMHITRGCCQVEWSGRQFRAREGQVVVI